MVFRSNDWSKCSQTFPVPMKDCSRCRGRIEKHTISTTLREGIGCRVSYAACVMQKCSKDCDTAGDSIAAQRCADCQSNCRPATCRELLTNKPWARTVADGVVFRSSLSLCRCRTICIRGGAGYSRSGSLPLHGAGANWTSSGSGHLTISQYVPGYSERLRNVCAAAIRVSVEAVSGTRPKYWKLSRARIPRHL